MAYVVRFLALQRFTNRFSIVLVKDCLIPYITIVAEIILKWTTHALFSFLQSVTGWSTSVMTLMYFEAINVCGNWKARSGLPISVNCTFFLEVTAEALRANIN